MGMIPRENKKTHTCLRAGIFAFMIPFYIDAFETEHTNNDDDADG